MRERMRTISMERIPYHFWCKSMVSILYVKHKCEMPTYEKKRSVKYCLALIHL